MSDYNSLQWWLTVLVIFIGYLYWRIKTAYKFWESRGIASVKPTFLAGNFGPTILGKESVGFSIKRTYENCKGKGPYAGFYMFTRPWLIVLDPEAVKTTMVKDFQYFHDRGFYHNEKDDPLSGHLFSLEGDRWRHLRLKFSPTFTVGKLKSMFQTMIETCDDLKFYMQEVVSKESKELEVKDILARFTIDVIGSCALGIQCKTLKNPEAEFRQIAKKIFSSSWRWVLKRLFFTTYKKLGLFLKIKLIDPHVTDFFLKAVEETMRYRQENNVIRNDFLQLLMQLRNKGELDDNEGEVISDKTSLTLNEATAQAFVFFSGGFETSAGTMSFCLYELAVNPGIQQKVRDEINMILHKTGGELTYEAALQMEYLDRVIYETMRKYPSLPVLMRECTKDYTLPNSTTLIPRGTMVFISVSGLHHDPEFYPDPDRFDPDRFTEENKSKRHHFAYLPFGEGPRICIGMRFGMMQTRLGLITMIRNYNILRSDKTSVPLKIDPKQFVTNSVGGISLKFEPIA